MDSFRKSFGYRGVEQLVARRAHNPKVLGSSPSPATRKPEYESIWAFSVLKHHDIFVRSSEKMKKYQKFCQNLSLLFFLKTQILFFNFEFI